MKIVFGCRRVNKEKIINYVRYVFGKKFVEYNLL